MRRVGSTPQQRGSASGATRPDVFELDSGDYLVIGKLPVDSDDLAAKLAEQGGSIGDGEQAVIVPRNCLRDATRDIAGEEGDG